MVQGDISLRVGLWRCNLVPKASLSSATSSSGETLVAAGHVAPRIRELTKIYVRGGVVKCIIVALTRKGRSVLRYYRSSEGRTLEGIDERAQQENGTPY